MFQFFLFINFKEALSVFKLCVSVFMYHPEAQSALLGCPRWGYKIINLTVATCHIQYTFLSLCQFFSRENGQTQKYSKSAIFVWYKKGHRRLLGVQSIDPERTSLKQFCQSDCTHTYTVHLTVAELLTLCLYLNFRTEDHIRLQGSSMWLFFRT